MEHFKIHATDVYIHYNDEHKLVKIRLFSKAFGIETSFNIYEINFLSILRATDIVEIGEDYILWDEYIEDDGEATRFNQHQISVKDYISNYITSYDVKELLEFILYGTGYFLLINKNNN
jgi:hypothetical protein